MTKTDKLGWALAAAGVTSALIYLPVAPVLFGLSVGMFAQTEINECYATVRRLERARNNAPQP